MPLQQHPVPQEISAYEFRLVGDMTLKQFLQLAGGVGIAFLIFVTPIPAFIRWPLVILAALAGAALAFLPIEERPLSFWIFSFLKAIYSPTYYVFKNGAAEDVYQTGSVLTSPSVVAPQGDAKAQEYLSSIPTPAEVAPFEENEKGFVARVVHLFSGRVSQEFTESATPKVEHTAKPESADQNMNVAQTPGAAYTPPAGGSFYGSTAAVFAAEAAPPNPPTSPNVVVGQVLDSTGKIVDGAILELREVGGPPVRALRTNKIGHFLTVTPLRDGEYEIETEKDGMGFDIIKIRAEGQILSPILIKAKT
ncbi:MAG: PrgI family protein [Patescibacteria group bacterium]